MKIVVLKSLGFRKLSHSSEIQKDVLMHREGRTDRRTDRRRKLLSHRMRAGQYFTTCKLTYYFDPVRPLTPYFSTVSKPV